MFSVIDYNRHLKSVITYKDYGLHEFKPTLNHLLLIPFENLSFVRKVRLLLEKIRGGYRVYYFSFVDSVVGYCVVTPGGRRLKKSTPEDIVLGPYYIAPEYRGNGYAKEMIRMTLSYSSYEYRYAYDWIDRNNISSIKVSEACGFKECGRLNVVGLFRRLVETESGSNIIFRYVRPNRFQCEKKMNQ